MNCVVHQHDNTCSVQDMLVGYLGLQDSGGNPRRLDLESERASIPSHRGGPATEPERTISWL